MNKEKELNTLKKRVTELLQKDSDCRNNDNLLVFTLLREMGFYINYDIDELRRMPSFEAITRMRRKLQNDEGRFLPNQPVQEARETNEEDMKWYFKPRRKRRGFWNKGILSK